MEKDSQKHPCRSKHPAVQTIGVSILSALLYLLFFVQAVCSQSGPEKRINPEIFLQTGHAASVNSVSYSTDGKFLASGSSDNTVKVWEATSRAVACTLSGHVPPLPKLSPAIPEDSPPSSGLAEKKVFISYARQDEAMAEKLCQSLKAAGVAPWIDKDNILPGQNWQLAIRQGLRDSDFILLLLSTRSLPKRGYIQKEVRMALDLADESPPDQNLIITARLDDCTPPDERLQHLHSVDLFPSYAEGFKRILMAIAP